VAAGAGVLAALPSPTLLFYRAVRPGIRSRICRFVERAASSAFRLDDLLSRRLDGICALSSHWTGSALFEQVFAGMGKS
jgi:hypothetical protein